MSDKKVIEPMGVYDLEEASVFFDVTPRTMRRYAKKLNARKVGRKYRVTGESILTFLGTPTISVMQPNSNYPDTLGVPSGDKSVQEIQNQKVIDNSGVPPQK